MRFVRLLALAAIVAAALTGCAAEDGDTNGEDAAGDGPAPMEATVQMQGSAFRPDTVAVALGGTVTWTNDDGVTHTVTGDGFDSGNLAPGDTFSQTFDEAGTYEYECTIHAGMRGTVTVGE